MLVAHWNLVGAVAVPTDNRLEVPREVAYGGPKEILAAVDDGPMEVAHGRSRNADPSAGEVAYDHSLDGVQNGACQNLPAVNEIDLYHANVNGLDADRDLHDLFDTIAIVSELGPA